MVRHPNEASARDRHLALACVALGDAAFDRLHAQGCTLRDEDVAALAFAFAFANDDPD